MDNHKLNPKFIKPIREAVYVALVYFVVSIIWVVVSDTLLSKLISPNTFLFKEMQTIKGLAFVFLSSLVVFAMVNHRVKKILRLTKELERHKKSTQAKIDYIGLHDTLTGLPKRMLLEKRFLNLVETNKENHIALVHLDIDNFSQINEMLGNVAGDQYILHISGILEESVKQSTLLSRLSNNAFGILLRNVQSKEHINNQVEAILYKLENLPWKYEGREFYTTASVGISTYPEDCLEFYCLLRYSNIALRHVKLTNQGKYKHYSKDTETKILHNAELVDDMKKALINNEFSLNYQIVLGLEEGSVEGVETLIRWHHPVKGNIPPLDFIPIAEQSDLISDITEYVINTAFKQKNDWRDEGYCIKKIAINISPNSMIREGFCNYIEEKLIQFGIKGEELILELTESTFIDDLEDINMNIKYLRDLGVEIALDDFGTGYSTFARLKDLNIDYLKLDRTFIMNMTSDSFEASLMKAVIDVAQVFNIQVCAEGIETWEVLDILKNMGCSLGQGYFIHKPSPILPVEFKYNICN